MFDLEEELKRLPDSPGVYFMFNENDEIIYIGKAKVLKNRVRQYFQNRSKGTKIDHMVTHIARFEYTITDSEIEALVLECNMIKTHRPKYNTMLIDDKTYPFIKVTLSEVYPRVVFTRKIAKGKDRYFGPYVNVYIVREIIAFLQKVYHIRSCNRSLPDSKTSRPCLNYHINRCFGCCQGYISPEEYRDNIDKVITFLSGNTAPVIKEIKIRMQEASEAMEYERAAEYLSLLNEVKSITQKQKITLSGGDDRDIIAVAMQNEDAVVQIFFIRGGRLIGREHYFMHINETTEDKDRLQMLLYNFITQFYSGTATIPKEIVVQTKLTDDIVISEWLCEKKGSKVTLSYPKKGTKEKLIELAMENASLILNKDLKKLEEEEKRTTGAVVMLEEALGLEGISRMEAYDISNINGFETVGSMVVYENGKPKKSDYRKFRIKSFKGQDDTRALSEVLSRRFKRGQEELKNGKSLSGFSKYPDLILMDGGKGQIRAAQNVLEDMGIFVPIAGMIKDDHHRTRGLLYNGEEKDLSEQAFRLITRIQDEAHRFAITFHRSIRSNEQVHSVLDDIPGVGPVRRKKLMQNFDSIDDIKNADVEELECIEQINHDTAVNIYNYFRQ